MGLMIQGYAALWSSRADGRCFAPDCMRVDGDVVLTWGHRPETFDFARLSAGTLRVCQDDFGVPFEADVPAGDLGQRLLGCLAAGHQVSAGGSKRFQKDFWGAERAYEYWLSDISLADNARFRELAAWRSDARDADLDERQLRCRRAFHDAVRSRVALHAPGAASRSAPASHAAQRAPAEGEGGWHVLANSAHGAAAHLPRSAWARRDMRAGPTLQISSAEMLRRAGRGGVWS